MRDELLQLTEAVMSKTGWAAATLESKFGSPGILKTIKHGKYGPGFNTAARFKSWLEDQLKEAA